MFPQLSHLLNSVALPLSFFPFFLLFSNFAKPQKHYISAAQMRCNYNGGVSPLKARCREELGLFQSLAFQSPLFFPESYNDFKQWMESYQIYGYINDVCVVGHGSIGRGTVPLIKRHFKFDKMTVVDPEPKHLPDPDQKVEFIKIGLTAENYREILDKIFVNKVGFLVNLSCGTSACDLIQYCQEKGVFYLDTVKEEWAGHYSDKQKDLSQRSNYGMRERLLREVKKHNRKTTAVSCCGANPGMVSWLVKQALLNLAKDTGYYLQKEPESRSEWGALMMGLGVKGVHIAERDTQKSHGGRKEGEFWNTWSVEGFIDEGYHQPAELGWGSHEKWMPRSARQHREGCKSAIYLTKPGMNVTVKSWCPTLGPQYGFLVTHDEAISISDYFTLKQADQLIYRPTCHYAYHPCQDAVLSALEAIGSGHLPDKRNWNIIEEDIVSGMDELGVLLYGHAKNAYWYGSQLQASEARKRAKYQTATSLQVCSAVVAGMTWALENPEAGLVECDQMDYKRCLEIQEPYISPVRGYYTDWTPLKNRRNELVDDDFDFEDPWQFKNIIINK